MQTIRAPAPDKSLVFALKNDLAPLPLVARSPPP